MSDELNKTTESFDLIGGINMRCVVREKRELEDVVVEERSCLWVVMRGDEMVVRSKILEPGWHVGRRCWSTNPEVLNMDLAASGSTGCAITWIKEVTFKEMSSWGGNK